VAEGATAKVTRGSENVVVTRWMIDQEPAPTFKKVGGFTGNVDRWQIIEWTPPAFLRLDTGATDTGTGAPHGKRVGGVGFRNLNAITPETESTSHYFWGQAHNFDVKKRETTEKIFDQVQIAFLEDVEVFSAQQTNMDLMPNAPQTDINADNGLIQARRILTRLHDQERAAGQQTAA
jgi:Vanillate O-demethylase oxygenase C-terminal domain